jgi:uncharacterized membrane protein
MTWKERIKEKKAWVSILGALTALGVLSASQMETIKEIFTAIIGS